MGLSWVCGTLPDWWVCGTLPDWCICHGCVVYYLTDGSVMGVWHLHSILDCPGQRPCIYYTGTCKHSPIYKVQHYAWIVHMGFRSSEIYKHIFSYLSVNVHVSGQKALSKFSSHQVFLHYLWIPEKGNQSSIDNWCLMILSDETVMLVLQTSGNQNIT